MKCVYHPEIDAIGVCVNCGKGLCTECKTLLGRKLYCRACAQKIVAGRLQANAVRRVSRKHTAGAIRPPKERDAGFFGPGGFFGSKKAGITSLGVVMGIIMMTLAVVWFVVGCHFGWGGLFRYLPFLLFMIGISAFKKGLGTRNSSGKS